MAMVPFMPTFKENEPLGASGQIRAHMEAKVSYSSCHKYNLLNPLLIKCLLDQ